MTPDVHAEAQGASNGQKGSRDIWLSKRAVVLHLTVLIVVGGCLYAAWWQANRALSGNTLSYIYSVEWPIFAGYGIFMWWKILHETAPQAAVYRAGESSYAGDSPSSGEGGEPGPDSGSTRFPIYDDSDDPERAAYNRYLANLAAGGKRKSW
ncbi:MAG TPA: hypothetical protein VMU77_05855 [Acidimicrobiales bacterium]|nr:hypothetical protein [Acidimicrobiales bacterium]